MITFSRKEIAPCTRKAVTVVSSEMLSYVMPSNWKWILFAVAQKISTLLLW